MTKEEACAIIGVNITSNPAEIEHAYRQKLQKLQLHLISGQSLSVRKRAEQQIARLTSAWEVLQKCPAQGTSYPWASRQNSTPQPAGGGTPSPQKTQHNWSGFTTTSSLQKPAVITSFLIAALMMVFITFLCFSAYAQPEEKTKEESNYTADPEIKTRYKVVSQPQETIHKKTSAQLRVLSVPWCYVQIDDQYLGTSGQAKSFELTDGKHVLILQREGVKLTKEIYLHGNYQTIAKVQYKKGIVEVMHNYEQ